MVLMTVDLAGLEPTASALQARRSASDELQARDPPSMSEGGMQLSDGTGVTCPKRPCWPFLNRCPTCDLPHLQADNS